MPMEAGLSIARVNAGDGHDFVRVRITTGGGIVVAEAEADFEAYAKALFGQSETPVVLTRPERVDISIAAQLRGSMEENARLLNGLNAIADWLLQARPEGERLTSATVADLIAGRPTKIGTATIKARKDGD